MPDQPRPEQLPPRRPREAAAQAIEFAGYMAGVPIDIGDEVWEVPNPSLLSDEQQERYDAMLVHWQEEREKFDRHPDTTDDKGETVKGEIKDPPRIEGKPVENYNTRLAKALLGDKFPKFIAAGGRSSQIQFHWHQMNQDLKKRADADPKSLGRDNDVDKVPTGDPSGPVDASPPVDRGVASRPDEQQ